MAMACSYVMKCSILVMFMQLVICMACGKLSSNFYESTCPTAISIIKSSISSAVSMEPRLGASFLHLHFHDCFVNGCDASVLLDCITPSFKGEKTTPPNNNSLRGFEVIDSIKSRLETDCPGVVSCADILTVATRDSVVALGGPSWTVELGRRDSTTASFEAANKNLPGPTSNLIELITVFSCKGFTNKEMVALLDSPHNRTSKVQQLQGQLYGETNMDITLATSLKWNCPNENKGGDNNLSPMDSTTPNLFDNAYYKNLLRNKGVLHSDQVMLSGGSTDSYVRAYSRNLTKFWEDFASAMVKMRNMSPLTGSQDQIRVNCRAVN